MKRAETLDTAKGYVTKDRQIDHGPPEDTFSVIARLWSVYTERQFTPVDVAMMLALLKIARQRGNPAHEDNYVDLAGYAACAAELAETWWATPLPEEMPVETLPDKPRGVYVSIPPNGPTGAGL